MIYLGNGDGTPDDYDLSIPAERKAFIAFLRDWWDEVKSLKSIDYSTEDYELEKERRELVEKAEKIKKKIMDDPNVRKVLEEFKLNLEGRLGTVFGVVNEVKDWALIVLGFSEKEKSKFDQGKVTKLRAKAKGLSKAYGLIAGFERLIAVTGILFALYILNKVSD